MRRLDHPLGGAILGAMTPSNSTNRKNTQNSSGGGGGRANSTKISPWQRYVYAAKKFINGQVNGIDPNNPNYQFVPPVKPQGANNHSVEEYNKEYRKYMQMSELPGCPDDIGSIEYDIWHVRNQSFLIWKARQIADNSPKQGQMFNGFNTLELDYNDEVLGK